MTRRGVALLAAALGLTAPARAQVDPSGEWRTLATSHFRIHFRPAYRAVAERAAREAERAWGLLATAMHPPRGIVDVTLADDVDAPNGFASAVPSNRVTVFLAPPATDLALQDYDDWLRLVLVHELAHVFHLDRSRGPWRGLQYVFGRMPGLFPNAYQPSWVTEGIATYYESRFTAGGRAEGSLHGQIVAAAVRDDAARSPRDALQFSRWPAGLAPYAYGGRFFARVARDGGDSLLGRFVDRSAGQWIPFRVGRPLRRSGGGDLDTAWERALGDVVTPRAGADTGAVLIGGLRSPPVPRVSMDGHRVAYLHDDGKGARRIRVAELVGLATRGSHRVTGEVRYDWRADTLLVSQLEFDGRRRLRSDLTAWVPGGAWRRITRGGRITEPRTSGGRLGTVVFVPGGNRAVVGDAATGSPGTEWGAVVPSPDGRWVVATRHRDGRWALVRWPAAAPESIDVWFDAGAVVSDPVWDGGAVLFAWDGTGSPQIYQRDGDGTVTVLTGDPHGARHPAPLRDGSLLYTSARADGWQLRRVATRRAAGADPPAARVAAAVFDSAPPVAVRETGYVVWPSLRPHFWAPLFRDAGVAGRFFGAGTAGMDAIGRFSWLAAGLGSGDPARAIGVLAVVAQAWPAATLDARVVSDWDGVGRTTAGIVVSEREQEAALGLTFVARRWRGHAALRLAAEYEADRFVAIPDTSVSAICVRCRRRDLVGASVTLGVAHYVTAPLAISAQDGFDWSVTVRRQERQGSGDWADELRSRLALYLHLPIGGFAYPVLAARVSAGIARGPSAGSFGVGGTSGDAVPLPGGQALGGRRSFPVRGYDADAVVEQRALALALELRIPLALVGRSVGRLPLGVDRMSLALFADAGDAWSSGAVPSPLRLRSVGGELVGDVTFPYDFPIRVRAGVARPLAVMPAGAGTTRLYAALGSDF